MPVILAMFDKKLGPVPFITIPANFDKGIVTSIARTIDIETQPGDIIINEFADFGMKSFNMQFNILSAWARGSYESLQLSVVTTEATPPEKLIRDRMRACMDRMMANDDIFKGFYINSDDNTMRIPEDVLVREGEIEEQYILLNSFIEMLDSETKVGTQKTSAILHPPSMIADSGSIPIPSDFQGDFERFISAARDGSKLFTIFRIDESGKMVSATCIVNKPIFLLEVEVESLNPAIIMKLRSSIPWELIYTNGFCQKRCLYEAYFAFDGEFDEVKANVEENVKKVAEIKSVTVSLVRSSV